MKIKDVLEAAIVFAISGMIAFYISWVLIMMR